MNDLYPLQPFRIRNTDTLCEVMRSYPLATLISGTAGEAKITLVPLLIDLDEENRVILTGHIDRNNEHANALTPGAPVSFQFLGPDAYASPDLYPDRQLPGWLYVSVQGDGAVSELIGKAELRSVLVRSTTAFGASGQSFALDSDDPRVGQFLSCIYGFRIAVTRISGIAKLAQDKGPDACEMALRHLASLDNADSRKLFERLRQETTADAKSGICNAAIV
jgi:transcriptional regulator